jgi:adenosylmethionine-8-amino-7-oxononanoate aminotransferase
VATKERFDPPIGVEIGKRALANGLITRFDPHWLALGPPLIVDEEHIAEIIKLLDQSITDVLAARA